MPNRASDSPAIIQSRACEIIAWLAIPANRTASDAVSATRSTNGEPSAQPRSRTVGSRPVPGPVDASSSRARPWESPGVRSGAAHHPRLGASHDLCRR
jgi:hypothetical protein